MARHIRPPSIGGGPQYPRESLNQEQSDRWGAIIDTVFFASLGKEEGEPTRISVVYHEDGLRKVKLVEDTEPVGGGYMKRPAWQLLPLRLQAGVTDFTVDALRKLAP